MSDGFCTWAHREPPAAGQERSVLTTIPLGAQTSAAVWAVTTLKVKDGEQSK